MDSVRVTAEDAARAYHAHRRRNLIFAVVLISVVFALFIIGLGMGRSSVTTADVVGILGQHFFGLSGDYPAASVNIVCNIRLPRVIAALLVGAALAISGASYQGIFKTPWSPPTF